MDLTWLSAILVGAGCLAVGYLMGRHRFACFFASAAKAKDSAVVPYANEKHKMQQLDDIEKLADILEDFKMVLVVRNDLKMGKGKIAAQCSRATGVKSHLVLIHTPNTSATFASHATLGLYKKLHRRAPKALNRWENCGQVKVVLKIESEEDMLVLQGRAKSLNLPNHITIDAGRTQIAPNSRTVMAILGPANMVDDVTGGLKLL